MIVTLNKDDITELIKKAFNGINSINVDDNIKALLDVDMVAFSKVEGDSVRKPITGLKTFPKDTPIVAKEEPPKSIEEVNEEEAKKGLMCSGGALRSIRHIG